MPDPYTPAANTREKARQEKNQRKDRARKSGPQPQAVRVLIAGLEDQDAMPIGQAALRRTTLVGQDPRPLPGGYLW